MLATTGAAEIQMWLAEFALRAEDHKRAIEEAKRPGATL